MNVESNSRPLTLNARNTTTKGLDGETKNSQRGSQFKKKTEQNDSREGQAVHGHLDKSANVAVKGPNFETFVHLSDSESDMAFHPFFTLDNSTPQVDP